MKHGQINILSMSLQEAYDELALYTLSHGDSVFIHQYIVDAYAAQYATNKTKPITLAFALIGLYLHMEKNYSGREVQLAHMKLAKKKREWPEFDIPQAKSSITIYDVLLTKPGRERDGAINEWSASVWRMWTANHEVVEKIIKNAMV